MFNIGTSRVPKWVRISKFGEMIQSETPQELIPQSYNKEDQIVKVDPRRRTRYLNLKIIGTLDDYKIRLGKDRRRKR